MSWSWDRNRHATLARLQKRGALMLRGNTDEWALHPHPHPYRNTLTRYVNAIELWSARQLTDADRALITTWPSASTLDLGNGQTLHGVHGSPRDLNERILPTTSDTELATMLNGTAVTMIAAGHTHIPMLRPFRDKLLINPGSVGYPIQSSATGKMHHPHWAEYATLNTHTDLVTVTFQRIPYDVNTLITSTRTSGMPYATWWLKFWT